MRAVAYSTLEVERVLRQIDRHRGRWSNRPGSAEGIGDARTAPARPWWCRKACKQAVVLDRAVVWRVGDQYRSGYGRAVDSSAADDVLRLRLVDVPTG